MGLRRFLATSGLCGILALGAASLTGCNSGDDVAIIDRVTSDGVTNREGVTQKDISTNERVASRPRPAEAHYSQLEERVYALVEGFSGKIPEGFVEVPGKDSYHESSLKIPPGENPNIDDASGAGRFVSKAPDKLNAGYYDMEEVRATMKTGDVKHLKKSVGFTKQLTVKPDSYGLVEDAITFMEGHEAVMYLKLEDGWRRKDITLEKFKGNDLGSLEALRALPEVSEEHVKRYLDLARRLDETYFKGK